jgi:hypothetical protein
LRHSQIPLKGWSRFEHSGHAWDDNRRRRDTWPARGAKHDAEQPVAELQPAPQYGYPHGAEEIFGRVSLPWQQALAKSPEDRFGDIRELARGPSK